MRMKIFEGEKGDKLKNLYHDSKDFASDFLHDNKIPQKVKGMFLFVC